MATKIAPPKSTGGGGFVFENDVGAWLLAAMLVGEPVFGAEHGVPVQLDFQARPDGWFLDDIVATTTDGTVQHRFALSIKSSPQFTAKSAPSDFVLAAWELWLHRGSTIFDADRDFVGLVTSPLSDATANSITGLADKARANDPKLFPARLAESNWATENQRALFSTFGCPSSLDPDPKMTKLDTARLLQRLRFIQHDFSDVASKSENAALELCRRAARSNTLPDARVLWSILRELASELRPQAGSLTLKGLIGRLRGRVVLADYPDHVKDWRTLDARSEREVALVHNSIAGRIRLPRKAQVASVIASLTTTDQVVLLGASGVGKSALARAVFESGRPPAREPSGSTHPHSTRQTSGRLRHHSGCGIHSPNSWERSPAQTR